MTEIIPFNRDFPDRAPKRITEVLIVASQELIRDVLRTTLSSIDNVRVIGESGHGDAAIQAAEELHPDVVVIESHIGPEAEGVRSGYRLKAARPSLGIVVVAHRFGDDVMDYLRGKTKAGWSFITRSAALDPDRIWRAISASSRGEGAIDAGPSAHEFESGGPVLERLTLQQRRALELLAAGVSDSGIANRMALTGAEAQLLVESLYDDMHVETGPRVDPRVVATLVYLKETVRLRS